MYFSVIFCLFLLLFLVYTDQGNLYVHFTNRFHVAMCQFSNRSQMTSKCGKNKEVAHHASELFQNSILFYYTFRIFLQQRAQKFGRFLFVHILSHRFKVARYTFSRSVPPKFERKLRRHKQRFGKIDTTVVSDKDENLL